MLLSMRHGRRCGDGWAKAQRAVTAGHDGRRGGGVCGDHQSLGRRQGVAPVGVGGSRGRVSRRVRASGEGLPRVTVVARVGVGVIVGFGVVPVAAVVGVGGRQRVVL